MRGSDAGSFASSSDLTEEQQLCREAFDFCDRDQDGLIDPIDFGVVVRSLGRHVTEAQLREVLLGLIDPGATGANALLDFEMCLQGLAEVPARQDRTDEVIQAFRVFDREGNGTVNAAELETLLSTLGEQMAPEEVEELLRDADVAEDGDIEYVPLAKRLFGRDGYCHSPFSVALGSA
mmetsp:Transcript_45921/g.99784  ORF Transcript_45921/g.99784 Transcript_45921/m.99784 type:complete len:178 (+) Transcript_45921:19-552(+)